MLKVDRTHLRPSRRSLVVGIVLVFAALGYAAITFSGAQQLPTTQDSVGRSDAVVPNDPEYSKQTALKITKVDQLWERTKGKPEVIVALVSSGVNASHPELAGRLVPGYDFVNNDTDASPDGSTSGAGTSTAGIIAAATNNGVGMAGICWECKIMPLDIEDEAKGVRPSELAAKAINHAIDKGAKVIHITNFWATELPAMTTAIKRANTQGIPVIAVVNNKGLDDAVDDSLPYPGPRTTETISVTGANDDDTLRPEANFGAKVDLAAPGVNVMALSSKDASVLPLTGNGRAASIVTGITALLLSLYPKATPAQIAQALVETADPCCAGKIGGGRVNAIKAADFLEKLYPSTPVIMTGDLNGDGKVNITDLSTLLSRWNSADAKADLNTDGKVGISDMSILLSNWTR